MEKNEFISRFSAKLHVAPCSDFSFPNDINEWTHRTQTTSPPFTFRTAFNLFYLLHTHILVSVISFWNDFIVR